MDDAGKRPMFPVDWPSCGDTGMSSTAIWTHMMGGDPSRGKWGAAYPHDPDDFGRCYRLLARFPQWRPRITEMVRYGAVWARLVGAWDELSLLWEAKMGTDAEFDRRKFGTQMRELYNRMHDLITEPAHV